MHNEDGEKSFKHHNSHWSVLKWGQLQPNIYEWQNVCNFANQSLWSFRLKGSLQFWRNHVDSQPFYELIKETTLFKWTDHHEELLKEIKTRIGDGTILAVPSTEHPFHIHVDSSNFGTGSILVRHFSEGKRIVSFSSRVFDNAEQMSRRGLYARSGAFGHMPADRRTCWLNSSWSCQRTCPWPCWYDCLFLSFSASWPYRTQNIPLRLCCVHCALRPWGFCCPFRIRWERGVEGEGKERVRTNESLIQSLDSL